MKYSEHFSNSETPQTEAIPGKKMKTNNAEGFSFVVSPLEQLKRFLILGSEGGTYYVKEKKLTVENAKNVVKLIQTQGTAVVALVVDVSTEGRAHKNDAAIFALALCATYGDQPTKNLAYAAITKVCRTGTHLFQFCQAVQDLRGWSRGLRSGVAAFYLERPLPSLANQLVKYRQRNGWTHRDVLRLAHPKASSPEQNNMLRWAVGKFDDVTDRPKLNEKIEAFLEVQGCADKPKKAIELIREHDLPREALPTELLNNVDVWDALLAEMPMTAMVRNLGKMTSVGLLKSNLSASAKKITMALRDEDLLRKSRIHPIALLLALKTYSQGKGDKGKLTWQPVQSIIDALDQAFYLSFKTVEPTRQHWHLGVDISGSMDCSTISGTSLTAREGAAAMSLVTAATEPYHEIMGFETKYTKLEISPKKRLDDVVKYMQRLHMGGTDCSLPMIHAMENKLHVDTFVVYTDSETWAGTSHPKQALDKYRQKMGVAARLIVVGLTATEFTIADPSDAGMLDVVGFDTATPQVMNNFSLS